MQCDTSPLCRKAVIRKVVKHVVSAGSTEQNYAIGRTYSLNASIYLHLYFICKIELRSRLHREGRIGLYTEAIIYEVGAHIGKSGICVYYHAA